MFAILKATVYVAAVLAGQSAIDAQFQHLCSCEDLRLEPPTLMTLVGIATGTCTTLMDSLWLQQRTCAD